MIPSLLVNCSTGIWRKEGEMRERGRENEGERRERKRCKEGSKEGN
jgi:hypothetical protein